MLSNKHFPVVQSIADKPDLAEELKQLRNMIYTLQSKLDEQSKPSASAAAMLTPQQLKQIRDALQAGGTYPLNVNGLLGVLTQVQP